MKRLTNLDLATIVKLRGLGFNQAEIGSKLNVSGSAISYQLRQIKRQAQEHGIDKTFNIHCAWLKETTK